MITDKTKCANFMNQAAIDTILQERNEDLMEQDRQLGAKNPKPTYETGTCCCLECYYGVGIESSPTMWLLQKVAGDRPIKRLCYRDLTNKGE